jgi:cytochrome c nitrite reductase small subunit
MNPARTERKKIPLYLAAMLGVLAGLGIFLTVKSNAVSYLSDDPAACVNCHIMGSYYASHARSAHGRGTTCNDCHVPHTNALAKYAFKARDGLYHASVFTLRAEPQAMIISDAGANVVQANCVRCHGHLTETVLPVNMTRAAAQHGAGRLCWDCHREVPHGRTQGISTAPNALVPYPTGGALRASRSR